MASLLFNKGLEKLMNGGLDFDTTALNVSLHTSSYAADKDHATHSTQCTNEISGTGYTAAGKVLANKTVAVDNTNDRAKFDADDLSWTSASFTTRAGVLYDDAGDYPIAYFDWGSDKTVSSGTFTIQWHANGIITLAQA